jgi:hypothetical protein
VKVKKAVKIGVSIFIYLIIFFVGYFAKGPSAQVFKFNSLLLIFVFLLPAQKIYSVKDATNNFRGLFYLFLLGCLVWDIYTAFIADYRPFFSDWYFNYPLSPFVLFTFLLLHGWLTQNIIKFVGMIKKKSGL